MLTYMEKMPAFVKNAIGQAQKQLTLLEGQARKRFTGTYSRIREYTPVKKVEGTLNQWRLQYVNKYVEQINLEPIRKQMEKLSNNIGQKAYSTIGLATKADLKTITNKINKLRTEFKKFTGREPKTTTTKNTN